MLSDVRYLLRRFPGRVEKCISPTAALTENAGELFAELTIERLNVIVVKLPE